MKIAITGGSGRIGRKLRGEFAGQFDLLRTIDRLPPETLHSGEESVVCDIEDLAAVERAFEGIDGVIHMAGFAGPGSFEEVMGPNIVGLRNVYEAARRQGVKRVVFGSSNHAVGYYPRGQEIGTDVEPRPDSFYGLTKVFGEACAALYYDKYGVKSLSMRIGNAFDKPGNERSLSLWISGRDLAQLARIGLEHPDVTCDVVYGVSRNTRNWYDNSRAFELGYAPQDDAETHLAHAMTEEGKAPIHGEAALAFQGGLFCHLDYVYPLRPARPWPRNAT